MTRAATTLAGPCTGARRRDFLLGLRHGQRVRAHVPSWCSGHGVDAGCSQRAGPPGQLTTRRDQTPAEGTGWVHAYNKRGPDALVYRRTGGRPPFAPPSRPASARRCPKPRVGPRLRPEQGLTRRRARPSSGWYSQYTSALGASSAARRSAPPCTGSGCRGSKPRSCSAVLIRSAGRPL
jgi:hypothetical protein